MKRTISTTLSAALLLGSTLMSAPVFADPDGQPSASYMAADALIARPIGAAITVAGAALFVVTLPFSALGRNIDGAAKTLVVAPARETFQRCLGCTNTGNYRKPKD